MIGCTGCTESARGISKGSFEIVWIVWSVHTWALSLWHFCFTEFALGCVWCNPPPPQNSSHQMIRGRADAAPNAKWLWSNWQLSCVRLRALSLHACRWEVSVLELMFHSTHSASDRWTALKKKNKKKKHCWMRSGEKLQFCSPQAKMCVFVCVNLFFSLLAKVKINISLVQICTAQK